MRVVENVKNAVIIECGDALATLTQFKPNSFHTCVTSPPYYNLRDYGVGGQLGLEATPDEYVEQVVRIFSEVRRVLREDGTLWLNLGDCMVNKQLLGIPWLVAFALQADGWWLRSAIIWHKPNPMPESVTSRPTNAYENVFLLSKQKRYFYDADAIREEGSGTRPFGRTDKEGGYKQRALGQGVGGSLGTPALDQNGRNARNIWTIPPKPYPGAHFAVMPIGLAEKCIKAGSSEHGCCSACGAPWIRQVERQATTYDGRQRPSPSQSGETHRNDCDTMQRGIAYLTETTGWLPSCHCAAEVIPCVVLDPFGGAGTTGQAAVNLGRDAVLIELNPDYCDLAMTRLRSGPPPVIRRRMIKQQDNEFVRIV